MLDLTYEELNYALCESIFTPEFAHQPSYVELSDNAEILLSQKFEITREEIRPLISKVIEDHIRSSGNTYDPVLVVYQNLRRWRMEILKGKDVIFPELPFLLVCTFAASEMGGDGEYNPNAYYPRLQNLLAVSTKEEIADSYRSCSSYIWGSLNYWLDVVKKGQIGIGTAYSIGAHWHVGFALSQALVRSGDRKKLPRLFRRNGLSPFSSLVEHDMESIIDEWVSSDDQQYGSYRNPSRPFKNLWSKSDARERISAIICRELESWDGRVPSIQREDGNYEDEEEIQIRLEATKVSFPTPALNVSFAVSGFPTGSEEIINVVAQDESRHAIALTPDPSGWFRPNVGRLPIGEVDLLENGLTVEHGGRFNATRIPKKIVVLRLDDLTRRYRETDRIELGVRALILVQEYRTAISDVEKILEIAARRDWVKTEGSKLKGLPANWTLFSEVELLQPPPTGLLKHANLESLKPIRSGTLTFSSGLQLPGRPPKWHGDAGIEIRATAIGAKKVTVAITEVVDGEDQETTKTEYLQSTIIHQIPPGELSDGDYRVEIFLDSSEDVFARKTLFIRSGDSTDFETWTSSERLVYDIGNSPSAALIGTQLMDGDIFVIDGALPVFDTGSLQTSSTRIPMAVEWWGTKTPIIESRVHNFQLTSASNFPCFEKGNHYIELPPALPNNRGTGFLISESGKIEGKCRDCGLIRRSPADPYLLQKIYQKKLDQKHILKEIELPKIDISKMPPVETKSISWDLALDGLMHLGGGPESYLTSIASNVDPSALFRHEFIRTLEMLGHIDVSRNSEHQVDGWEINPSIVVQTNSDFFLTGYWPTSHWTGLLRHFGNSKVFDIPSENSVTRLTIKGVTTKEIEKSLNDLGIEASIAVRPSLDMLKMLPNIKSVAEHLPSSLYGLFDEISQYDSEQNAWIPISGVRILKVGGYRLTSAYRNQYAVVVQEDLELGRIRFTSSEFAKFFSSALTLRKPLFSFHPEKNQLVVPIGAPLPGMFGRAATLASGWMPKKELSGRYLVYENVEKNFAEILAAKLGGQ